MDTIVKKLYEGLFLVDSGEAAADWNGINDTIEKALARGDAEIVSTKKWDERRLAYDIDGKSRGTYMLTYFRGDPAKIGAIERAVQLSERIMRVLITRTDKMSAEDIEKAPPAATTERPAGAAKPAGARVETKAVKDSAAESKRRGGAKASKEAEAQKPEQAKAEAAPGSSAKQSRDPQDRRKSAQDSKGTAPPKSDQAKE